MEVQRSLAGACSARGPAVFCSVEESKRHAMDTCSRQPARGVPCGYASILFREVAEERHIQCQAGALSAIVDTQLACCGLRFPFPYGRFPETTTDSSGNLLSLCSSCVAAAFQRYSTLQDVTRMLQRSDVGPLARRHRSVIARGPWTQTRAKPISQCATMISACSSTNCIACILASCARSC